MNLRTLIYIFMLACCCGHASAGLIDHLDLVSRNCQEANTLLIKKSLLELKRSMNCDDHFTKQLLKNCNRLNCSILVESFKKNIQGRSGSVVGE